MRLYTIRAEKGNGCTKNVETCHRRVSTSGGAYKNIRCYQAKHQMILAKSSDLFRNCIRCRGDAPVPHPYMITTIK